MSAGLFQLLPALYKLRDAQLASTMQLLTADEQALLASLQAAPPPLAPDQQAELDALVAKSTRGPLQSLLMVIDEQLAAFAADLDQLYDDQFIETCAPWVIPYIGDLIDYQPIHGIPASVDNPRAEVAETISLRRRKGTVLVLEQLARDVTGWGAHAVEFFQVLSWTQYMKYVRPKSDYAPDVRSWRPRYYRDSGFSRMSRRVDVRLPASPGLPRYNIQNIGIFLWSLGAYSLTKVSASLVDAGSATEASRWRLNPLGADMPLFHKAVPQGETITVPAEPANTPDYLSRLILCDDLQKGVGASDYGEGASASLALYLDGLVDPWKIQVADLSDHAGSWNNLPKSDSPYAVVIDPELGRAAVPPPPPGKTAPKLSATYAYGFNADIGGGEYERSDRFVVTEPGARVLYFPDTTQPYTTVQEALNYVVSQLPTLTGQLALEIQGSDVATLAGPLAFDLPAGTTVEIRAADGSRPTLLLDHELVVTGEPDSAFVLSGLVLAAAPDIMLSTPVALVNAPKTISATKANSLGALTLNDCTLVPGWSLEPLGDPVHPDAAALVAGPPGLQVTVNRSILGAIRATDQVTVSLTDSILDATKPDGVAYAGPIAEGGGGALTLVGVTVVGNVHAKVLTLVSNSIVWAVKCGGRASGLVADRRQAGCVRFSFLPVDAVTPKRFQCVEQALASPQPLFISLRYGRPAYLKMLACTDASIRKGADDGGEMGAFHLVLAPLRETDLLARLKEFLPVGLDVGLIYQT
jgi:hypothetical protein